jgi:hypothetical protein
MKESDKTCIRCTFFRLDDEHGGVCRRDKSKNPDYPHMKADDRCESWRDCGQQYFIRLGWLKRRQAELQEERDALSPSAEEGSLSS